jgi:outer membrane receptor protein involved in Fe transport
VNGSSEPKAKDHTGGTGFQDRTVQKTSGFREIDPMTTNKRGRDFGHTLRAALFNSCVGIGMLAVSAPVFAQDQKADGEEAAPAEAIVITGSRIARQDYSSNSPIVTVGAELLQQSSTAAIEQNLNKLPQFTPAKTPANGAGDIQPTATNTPGAATVSLRGLGANRNLVLLDGRRATPSNAAGVVDINTIPSAAVERVEIISGGASATYGADAVAGVTNFILKKNFKGFELDGQTSIANAGDGFEYAVSGIMGTDFEEGRGNISIAMSLNTREASYQRNRPWFQALWADPNIATNRFFPLYPGIALGSGNAPSNNVFYNQLFPGTTNLGVGGFNAPQTTPPGTTNGQPLPNHDLQRLRLCSGTPELLGLRQSQWFTVHHGLQPAGRRRAVPGNDLPGRHRREAGHWRAEFRRYDPLCLPAADALQYLLPRQL